MKVFFPFSFVFVYVFVDTFSFSQSTDSPQPVFRNGQAQIVRAFNDAKTWIYEELWVETDFDSDRDGKPDRMHVYVTRPPQTESGTLKLPVIYNSSPYFGLKLWSLIGIGYKGISYDLNLESILYFCSSGVCAI